MSQSAENLDTTEVRKFEEMASRWWDPDSDFKTLHDINPLRLDFINQHLELQNAQVLDVGCGGGILAESMARQQATVTGIDASKTSIEVAKLHLHESQLAIDYQHILVENLADQQPHSFDVITCMEMLEHVPDPASVISSIGRLLKPNGYAFFSTINRNPKAWVFAILGAEYMLNMLPRGTHDYSKFIRPSELDQWLRQAELHAVDITGLTYNPLSRIYRLDRSDVSVNYLVAATKA